MRRINVFGPNSEFVRTITRSAPGFRRATGIHRRPEGTCIVVLERIVSPETRVGTLYRDAVPVVRVLPNGVILDTIGLFPGRELFIPEEFGLPAIVLPPFRTAPVTCGSRGIRAPRLEPAIWTILAPDGRMVGDVEVLRRFRLLDAGANYVRGLVRDAAAVEHVLLYELIRPA